MDRELLNAGIFLLLFLVIIVAAHLMYKAHVDTEKSRKFVHVAGGTLSLFLPWYFTDHWYVLVICSVAFILLLITWIRKDLPGIHKTKRKSIGSVLFPAPIYICFFAYFYFSFPPFFYIPVLLLTFADTAAELGGRQWGKHTRSFFKGKKTLAGSLCFFISAILIIYLSGGFYFSAEFMFDPIIQVFAIGIAIITTLTELVSRNGWDNLTVPLAALAIMMGIYIVAVWG